MNFMSVLGGLPGSYSGLALYIGLGPIQRRARSHYSPIDHLTFINAETIRPHITENIKWKFSLT
jgi:hypothetical protein